MSVILNTNSYVSLQEANNYLSDRPNNDEWFTLSSHDRSQYLIGAVDVMEAFVYIGNKLDSNQVLQFPRDVATVVPMEIKAAQIELANFMAKGIVPDGDSLNKQFESVTVGPLNAVFAKSSGSIPNRIRQLLSRWLDDVGLWVVRT